MSGYQSKRDAAADKLQEPVAIMPSNTRYTVEVEGHGHTYWDNIHDAITSAQRAVYAGVDNTTRALEDLTAGRIAEWSYGFSAVRIYPPQNTTPPQRKPLTDADYVNACISYRHDFGLMTQEQRDKLIFQAREWARAFGMNEAAHSIKENA